MRLTETDAVAGICAITVRDLELKLRSDDYYRWWVEDYLSRSGVADPAGALDRLAREGYVSLSADGEGSPTVGSTARGKALSLASVGEPITRAVADQLVASVVERARAYNADPSRLLLIERLRLFGPYVDSPADVLGDVDVELSLTRRPTTAEHDLLRYAELAGRTFGSLYEKLCWAQTELVGILRGSTTAIAITLGAIERAAGRIETIFEAEGSLAMEP